MEIRKYIIVLFALLTSPILFSQILSGDEPKKEEKPKKEVEEKINVKPTREMDNQSSVYLNTNWSNTSRKLVTNEGLFAQEIGDRANETNANFWSFGLGIRTDLNKNFRFSIGLGYLRNGEKYSFVGEDSTFNYTSTYRYISMPLVLDFVFGKKLKFNFGAGIVPQMMMSYTQDQTWTNSVDAKGEFKDKRKGTDQGFNQMLVSAVVNAGVQYKYGQFWSIYFMPEARFQLPNTYSKNEPYDQKAIAIGFNLGLSYQL
jgi:hypothetical protein